MINSRGTVSLFIFTFLAFNLTFGQQGRMGQIIHGSGGFAGGGMQGFGGSAGFQGSGQQNEIQTAQTIQNEIDKYLNSNPITAILTPGEFVEYTLKLKKDEVVIADAKSDAFDPALEVVDGKGKVLGQNDDRYPGDQRPLLLWRAPAEGTYFLHVTSFRNKAGGEFTVRFNTYQSFTLTTDKTSQYQINKDQDKGKPILLRESLKAGEVATIRESRPSPSFFSNELIFGQYIFENGLPVPSTYFPFPTISNLPILVAPVSGDYYVLINPMKISDPNQETNFWVQKSVTQKIDSGPQSLSVQSNSNEAKIYELSMKKLDFLSARISGSDRNYFALMAITKPDFNAFDLSDSTKNPFFPGFTQNSDSQKLTIMPVRPVDPRYVDFYALADQTIWIASREAALNPAGYNLAIGPAAEPLPANGSIRQKLQIGWTNYSRVPLDEGDIMTLTMTANGFRPRIHIFDPSLRTLSDSSLPLDDYLYKTEIEPTMSGKYIVAISCVGDGGKGDYSLSAALHPPRTLSIGSPGLGTIEPDQVQVWKFTVLPSDPVILHLNDPSGHCSFRFANNEFQGYPQDQINGSQIIRQIEYIDATDSIAIMNPDKPTTYTLIVHGYAKGSNYSITLEPILHHGKSSGKSSQKPAYGKGT